MKRIDTRIQISTILLVSTLIAIQFISNLYILDNQSQLIQQTTSTLDESIHSNSSEYNSKINELYNRINYITSNIADETRKISEQQRLSSKDTHEIDYSSYINSSVRVNGYKKPDLLNTACHGTGVVISEDSKYSYILTAFHVIDQMVDSTPSDWVTTINVPIQQEQTSGITKLVWDEREVQLHAFERNLDLAIIRTERILLPLKPIKLAKKVKTYDPVFNIGYPGAADCLLTFGNICFFGYPKPLANCPRWKSDKIWIVSISCYFGDSGGAILSNKNPVEIIGITVGGTINSYNQIVIIVPFPVIQQWFREIHFCQIINEIQVD